jgi:hypothetical protein
MQVTYQLAMAVLAYAAIGTAWASYAVGSEQAKPPPEATRLGLGDLALLVAAWPLWAVLVLVAKYLGRDK